MNQTANKGTGPNAGGPRQLPARTCWDARVGQFHRSPTHTGPSRHVNPSGHGYAGCGVGFGGSQPRSGFGSERGGVCSPVSLGSKVHAEPRRARRGRRGTRHSKMERHRRALSRSASMSALHTSRAPRLRVSLSVPRPPGVVPGPGNRALIAVRLTLCECERGGPANGRQRARRVARRTLPGAGSRR